MYLIIRRSKLSHSSSLPSYVHDVFFSSLSSPFDEDGILKTAPQSLYTMSERNHGLLVDEVDGTLAAHCMSSDSACGRSEESVYERSAPDVNGLNHAGNSRGNGSLPPRLINLVACPFPAGNNRVSPIQVQLTLLRMVRRISRGTPRGWRWIL